MSGGRPTPRTTDEQLSEIANGPAEVIEPETDLAMEALKDRISAWLSALALLSIAVGTGWGLWVFGAAGRPWGPFGLIPAGIILAFMLSLSDASRRPKPVTVPTRKPAGKVPGPTAEGNLHAKGPGASA